MKDEFDLLGATESAAGARRETGPVFDPRTGEAVREFFVSDEASVDASVTAAHTAWTSSWRDVSAATRAGALLRIAAAIRSEADALARLEAIEVGKPFSQARNFDLEMCIGSFEYFAGLLTGSTSSARFDGPATTLTEIEPFGVVAAILPFNWPPIHTAAKTAPALAAGNAVLIKPPEQAPSAVVRLCEIIAAELPGGLVSVVSGGVPVVKSLIDHPLVAKVSFTGSPDAGRAVATHAARTLTPVMLELGGKNPFIVLPGAHVEDAVRSAVEGAYFNQGEACTAASRLLIHRSVHDEFVELLGAAVERLVVGDPLDPATHLGPLVSKAQQRKVLQYIQIAQDEGAVIAAQSGHEVPDEQRDGYWVRPTLLTRVEPQSTFGQEEAFGPVAGVIPFDETEEAIEIANGTPYALAAGVFDRDTAAAWDVARRIDAGIVFINNYNRSILGTPFGGNRASGYGREHAPETLLAFGRSKSYKMPNGRGEIPRWPVVDEVMGA